MGSLLIQRFRLRKLARVRVPGGSESFSCGGRVCARGGSIMNAHRLANHATMLPSKGAESPRKKTEVKKIRMTRQQRIRQARAIGYAERAKQRAKEERYLISVDALDAYKIQTKYKTMRGYINFITNGNYRNVIR